MKKKIITAVLVIISVFQISTVAWATDIEMSTLDPALDYAAQVITSKYTDYYTIQDVNVNVLNTTIQDGIVEYYAEISFGRVLLADEATDLPYVAGSVAATNSISNGLLSDYSVANNYVEDIINEIENEYIGKVQSTTVYVFVSAPTDLNMSISYEEQCEVFVETLDGSKVSPSVLAPKSVEEMYQDGQKSVNYIASATKVQTASVNASSNIQSYNRVTARNYAREWSCTGGYLADHTSCHNPQYSFYENVDCANFVSQCLHEGGISTDTIWYKDSSTWIGVTKLCNYLVNNDMFFECDDEDRAFAGSIIRWTSGSHVGLVDQNDTVTMTFCAHTRCRNSCSWAGEDVYFYIPYWDSYTGVWVEN